MSKTTNKNRLYKIWSIEHDLWWKPGKQGYTPIEYDAGVYSFEDALEIVERANFVVDDVPNEAMVPV